MAACILSNQPAGANNSIFLSFIITNKIQLLIISNSGENGSLNEAGS
jgi:hypothetical protein